MDEDGRFTPLTRGGVGVCCPPFWRNFTVISTQINTSIVAAEEGADDDPAVFIFAKGSGIVRQARERSPFC